MILSRDLMWDKIIIFIFSPLYSYYVGNGSDFVFGFFFAFGVERVTYRAQN